MGVRTAKLSRRVSHLLDNIGLLIAKGLLEPAPAATFLGGSAVGMWKLLAPFIYAERRVNDRETYQRYFEDAAARFDGTDIAGEIAKLNRLPPELAASRESDRATPGPR